MDGTHKSEKAFSGNLLAWEVAYRKCSRELPEHIVRDYIDKFELAAMDEEKAVIRYRGNSNLQYFQEKYEKVLCWALGGQIAIEYQEAPGAGKKKKAKKEKKKGNQKEGKKDSKREKRQNKAEKLRENQRNTGGSFLGKLLAVCGTVLAVVVLLGIVFFLPKKSFQETFLSVTSEKSGDGYRIVQLSDLRGQSYGENNEELTRRVGLLEPDLIVMTGDMTGQGRSNEEDILELCRNLTETAPVYYVYGGNESDRFLDDADPLKARLEEIGVHVLWDEMETLEINGAAVDIYGVLGELQEGEESPYGQFLNENPDHFKLMLSHEPYALGTIGDWPDLTLSGHTLGGSFALPGVGAIYEKEYGMFPELDSEAYVSGKYTKDGNTLIVCSGLAKSGAVRGYRQPELMIIDVNQY